MLLDLNKEIMNELGVTVVGDIIAILKHAKVVHRQVGSLLDASVSGFRVRWRAGGRTNRRLGSKGRHTWIPRLAPLLAV